MECPRCTESQAAINRMLQNRRRNMIEEAVDRSGIPSSRHVEDDATLSTTGAESVRS